MYVTLTVNQKTSCTSVAFIDDWALPRARPVVTSNSKVADMVRKCDSCVDVGVDDL